MANAAQTSHHLNRIRRLNAIGVALSAVDDHIELLEQILNGARELTCADAGTLYWVNSNAEGKPQSLSFTLVQNDTLNIHLGGSGEPVGGTFSEIPLYLTNHEPNERMVAAYAVLHEKTVCIADAYEEQGFDFSGTRKFDASTGYRSQSMLVVPLKNHENDVIAALQLLNKQDNAGNTVQFDQDDIEIACSLASQAAIALTNRKLIDDLHTLFESFTHVIASAIDAKSPQTGAHCRRVPDATLMLAKAASGSNYPGLEGFKMSKKDMYELKTAAWMHDCGKIVTPPHVVEKSKKLETIYDRIGTIEARLEVLARDAKIAELEAELTALKNNTPSSRPAPSNAPSQGFYQEALEFLQRANTGGEFMADDDLEKVQSLAALNYTTLNGQTQPLLTPEECENLCIRKGTLTDAERKIMEDHMVHTINMLEQLPFPKHLKRVPEYAGGHHERMDGKGYPRGLTREQMSIPARIMGIADVFEALTAPERSYKKAMSLSQTLTIMGRMVENNHLDPDLFALFVDKKVYLTYANKHLKPEQIDNVDLSNLPGLSRNQHAE
ncbi:HD domain-containing phosphohydrolase [Aliidiomarina celeris]|uniref:HD domain-containing phosphohydrolase n=1 Tax=Aliidiomarina celeris TaxID=2249428 RepID=UPI000DEB9423|nr:HD domain-containing phosphohydrolase [Aliidiomarina celeris]